jgi:hypothetical protein
MRPKRSSTFPPTEKTEQRPEPVLTQVSYAYIVLPYMEMQAFNLRWKKGSRELLFLAILEAFPCHGSDISKPLEPRLGRGGPPGEHGLVQSRWVERARQRGRRDDSSLRRPTRSWNLAFATGSRLSTPSATKRRAAEA